MNNQLTYYLKNISKTYNNKMVLHVDELSIYGGQIMGLLGASGSGKSTLLRLLNFIEATDTGQIKFLDYAYTKNELPGLSTRRKITTVFQRPFLMTTSVWQNIIYPLKIRNQKIEKEKVEDIILKLGLSDIMCQRADKLSGGEAQRVSLARALVFRPQVILLDEPTSNLDPSNVKIIEDMIQEYVYEENATVVMITHNVFQAKRLANRVSLLYKGELAEVNDKDEFFNNSKCEVTKKFLSGELVF